MKARKITAILLLIASMLTLLCSCGVKKAELNAADYTAAYWVQTREDGVYDIDASVIPEIVRMFNEAELEGKAKNENPVIGFGVALIGENAISVSQFDGDRFIVKGDGKPYVIVSEELCDYLGEMNAAE